MAGQQQDEVKAAQLSQAALTTDEFSKTLVAGERCRSFCAFLRRPPEKQA